MNCSVCKRRLGNHTFGWYNLFLGIQDLKDICEECDMSFRQQCWLIYKELYRLDKQGVKS